MPLIARRADDHYPDREKSRPDYFVVLSGALEVGRLPSHLEWTE